MAAYIVRQADTSGGTMVGGENAAIVVADNATVAKSIAAALYGSSADIAARWTAGTATELVAPDSLEGMRFRVKVVDPSDDSVVADVTITSVATDDIDDVGGDLATALNATASIANAAWSAGTLTIASGSGGDDLGDHVVSCFCYPNADRHAEDVEIAGVFSSIVDEGAATDPLSVAIAMVVQPHVYGMCKMPVAPVASTAT